MNKLTHEYYNKYIYIGFMLSLKMSVNFLTYYIPMNFFPKRIALGIIVFSVNSTEIPFYINNDSFFFFCYNFYFITLATGSLQFYV